MEGGEPVMVSVITLCRDNPDVLRETLESIREQCLSPNYAVEVLVVDGSGSPRCREVVHHYPLVTEGSGWRLRWTAWPPRGIYEALNAGLELVRGRWVHMLPAGDAYADAGSLQRLLRHAEGLTAEQGHPPAAVFGQAWVEVPGRPLRWLTPDPRVRSIGAWLARMVPCHQAVLFEADWARTHPYPAGSRLYGDRPVMRAALAASGPGAYLAEPVCRFRLGGLSSGLPDGRELLRRWRDPALDLRGCLIELLKALLWPLADVYPHLMRARAAWMGWRC